MSSVCEASLTALVSVLNTGTPVGLPATERDRWIDVEAGPTATPVVALNSYEDDTLPGQEEDRYLDFRRVKAGFEIYASKTATLAAREVVDAIVVWVGSKAGPVDAGSGALASAGIVRVQVLKRTAVVASGDASRCLLEVALDYRNVTNDLTRVQ